MDSIYLRALISATSEREVNRILDKLLEERLVAGGLITKGLSKHWWKGKVDVEEYYNISAFTLDKNKERIIETVKSIHKDAAPIVAFFKIEHGNEEFLDWIRENVK